MKRLLVAAMAAAVSVGATAAMAGGQEAARLRRFELSPYIGIAYTTAWFEAAASPDRPGGGDTYTVGFAPIFGGAVRFWTTPKIGFHLHAGFMPSGVPNPRGFDGDFPQKNLLTDLGVVFRPLLGRSSGSDVLNSAYLFAGGGIFRTWVDGEGCLFLEQGACLHTDADVSTVGQGVLGFGADLYKLSGGLSLFGEMAVHGYDSPVHTHCHFVGSCRARAADYDLAVTPRIGLGVKMLSRESTPPAMPVPPPAAPPR